MPEPLDHLFARDSRVFQDLISQSINFPQGSIPLSSDTLFFIKFDNCTKLCKIESVKRQEKLIIEELKAGRFQLTLHARNRMSERLVSEADIVYLAHNLRSIRFQSDRDTYLLNGENEWGDSLFVSVALRESVIIVTVFYEDDEE